MLVKKYSAALHIFNSLLSVLSGDETLCLMLDILHKTLVRLLQELCMSSPNWVFSAYIFLCDLDYLQEILLSLETIIIKDSIGGIVELGCVSFSLSGLPCSCFCFAKTAQRKISHYEHHANDF